jgi:hypothetical protein
MPKLLDRQQARSAATGLAAFRAGVGALAVLLPGLTLRPWIGKARETGTKLVGRSLGARDIALGAGAMLAERHDTPVRGWVEAGALSDAGDLVATLIAFRKLPRFTRWPTLLVTAAAVAAGGVVAPCVDREDG